MAHRGFTTASAGNDSSSTTQAWTKFVKWTGSTPQRSTTGNYGNKFSMFCENSIGLRSENFVDAMPDDAWGWFTADLYLTSMEVETAWMILSSNYFVSSAHSHLGIKVERDTAANGSGLKFHLVKFNFDSFGAPENYTNIADNGDFGFSASNRIRIQVRQYYNSGDDNMDVEVWINGTKEINEIDITKIGTKTWAAAADSQWTVSQFEETSGKGGVDFDVYWSNFIWNDELSGVGPSAQPDDNYVVVSYQMNADTDDLTRDDFTKGGSANLKYQHVDDDYTDRAEDTYIYVQQSLTDEQEMKVADHVQKAGGTAQVDAIYVTAQAVDNASPTPQLRAAWLEAAIHCTGGAAWTPAIFDTLLAILRRKTLSVGVDLRVYQVFVVVLGKDLENAANNPNSDNSDVTPSGEVSSFVQSGSSALDASFFWADFDEPPAAPAAGFAHSQVVM